MTKKPKIKEQIETILESTNRGGIENILTWLEDSDFYKAPASTKYHNNHKGGLAEHSLSVYKTLDIISKIFGIDIPDDTLKIVGLLHDVCKVDIYKGVKVEIPPKRMSVFVKETIQYKHNDTLPLGHGEKSVIQLIDNGLSLTKQEMLMIRWHMNMYDPAYDKRTQKSIDKYCPEARLLFFADSISSSYLEKSFNVL